MHQQEVRGVRLLTDHLRDARCHRDSGHAGGADQGVDLLAGELAHDVAADQTADRGDAEGNQTEQDDLQRLDLQEVRSDHGRADRGREHDGDDVHQGVLHGVRQTVGAAALAEEVAEHQAANQRRRGRQKQDDKDGDNDREENLLALGDDTRLNHLDLAVFLAGQKLHNRRLNQRNQRHIGVGGDCDGAEQLGCELVGQEDCRRTVCAADDADGRSLRTGEAEADRAEEGDENAELGSSAQKQALRVSDQRTKVGHCTDAHENQRRIQTSLDADVEDVQQTCVRQDVTVAVIVLAALIEEVRPQLGVIQRVGGVQIGVDRVKTREIADVCKQAAERNADQQQRLEALDNAEVQQHARHDDHHEVLPAAGSEETGKAGFCCQLRQRIENVKTHVRSSLCQNDQRSAGFHNSTLARHDLCNRAVARGEDFIFHLHGFQNHEDIAGLDSLTLRNVDAQDVAGHRGCDDFAGCNSSGCGSSGGCRCGSGCSGRRGSGCGGSGGSRCICLVLVNQHRLTGFYLNLVGFAIERNLILHLSLDLLDGFEAQLVEGLV